MKYNLGELGDHIRNIDSKLGMLEDLKGQLNFLEQHPTITTSGEFELILHSLFSIEQHLKCAYQIHAELLRVTRQFGR